MYEIKRRDDSKALICLVDSDARLQRYVRNVPDAAWQLIDVMVKPTTLILDGAQGLAPNLIAEDGSIGIRITKEEFSHELCYRFQKAIVSTSANISGEPTAQTTATSQRIFSTRWTMYANLDVRNINLTLHRAS